MAEKACAGVIKIGSALDVIGDLRGWRQNSEANEIDTTVMGNCVSRFQPGSVRDSLEADTYFLPGDAGQALLYTQLGGVAQSIEIYPLGEGAGKPVGSGNFYIMSRNVEAAVDGAVEIAMTLSSDESGISWASV